VHLKSTQWFGGLRVGHLFGFLCFVVFFVVFFWVGMSWCQMLPMPLNCPFFTVASGFVMSIVNNKNKMELDIGGIIA
jgi:hypothetical protein